MNNIRKIIYLFGVFFVFCCSNQMIKDKRLHFINNSNKRIYLEYSPDNNEQLYLLNNVKNFKIENEDTVWFINDHLINPNDTFIIPGYLPWEKVINEMSVDKKCYFYFVDFEMYKKKINGEKINDDLFIVKRAYSLDDLIKMNWTIKFK